jgi:thymidylate synthase ThyX
MADLPSTASETLTPGERELLAPYVTNTQGSVFALTHLPEVIKGALFSRYSRSALGLRLLLLKEFIQAPEADFAGIAGGAGAPGGPPGGRLAVERAQSFYDRILDGYGDDSIGELGGAHLALEDVSMIAAKELEDARIGGSPLEKSTRYVSFADKVGGEYRFCREPTLLASRHRERYLGTCRALFQTYAELLDPVGAWVSGHSPRAPDTGAAAWRQSVRAGTFDALRGLLPAATLTNVGIFGNGRFFETLLIKLHLSPLAELRGLGAAARAELAQVIPSFIRRGDPAHPHFAGFRDHARAQQEALRGVIPALPVPETVPVESVRLVDFDPQAEAKILAALLYPHVQHDLPALRAWAAALPEDELAHRFREVAEARQNRRHKPPRAFEAAYYTFDLLGDFGMYRDLHRHRMLTQQRQTLTTRHGYDVPEEVEAAGVAARYRAALALAADAFEAIQADHPLEAQYVVPMAYRIRWTMHINLRALLWLVELRSQPQGHPAYRRMAQDLFRRVAEVHPRLAEVFRFVDLGDHALGRLAAEQRHEERQPGRG